MTDYLNHTKIFLSLYSTDGRSLLHTFYVNSISTDQDESGLCNDLGFLAHLPELCDITFMVGPDKEPVCAVRAVLGTQSQNLSEIKIKLLLAARSPKFLEKLYMDEKRFVLHSPCFHKPVDFVD